MHVNIKATTDNFGTWLNDETYMRLPIAFKEIHGRTILNCEWLFSDIFFSTHVIPDIINALGDRR